MDDTGTGLGFTVQAVAPADAGYVCGLLQAATAGLAGLLEDAPLAPLHRVPVLGEAQRRLVLEGWNDTARDVPGGTLPGLFAARAARVPDAVAVTDGDAALTYAGLDAAAGRLAGLLAARGAGPESVVAVLMERSAGLVTALLAVLKAGAAYLPVDPGYPAERIAFMLADAAPVLVLADTATAGLVPDGAGVPVLVMDDPAVAAELAGCDPAGPGGTGLLPAHPAYVIYTSGLTGTPKGVVVTHAGGRPAGRAVVDPFAVSGEVPGAAVPRGWGLDDSVWSCAARCCAGAVLVFAAEEAAWPAAAGAGSRPGHVIRMSLSPRCRDGGPGGARPVCPGCGGVVVQRGGAAVRRLERLLERCRTLPW